MSLQKQIFLAFSVVIVLLMFVIVTYYFGLNKSENQFVSLIENELQVVVEVGEIEAHMLECRRDEKDFLLRKNLKYLAKLKKNVKLFKEHANNILKITKDKRILEQTGLILKYIDEYKGSFESVVQSWQKKGLTHKEGLQGKFRNIVHELSAELKKNKNNLAMVSLLTIRKHEKDYLLRNDNKYVTKNLKELDNLKSILTNEGITKEVNSLLFKKIDLYKESFLALVNENKVIKKKISVMRTVIHKTQPILEELRDGNTKLAQTSKIETKNSISKIVTITTLLTIFILFLSIFTAYIISNKISKPILTAISFAEKIAEGNLTETLNINRKDEIGSLSNSLNTMSGNLKEIIVDLSEKTQLLASSSEELSSTSTNMVESIKYISEQANNLETESEHISEKTEMVASAIEESSSNVQEVSYITQNIKENTGNMNIHANTLLDKMVSVSSAIEEMNATVSEITKNTAEAADISNEASSQAFKTETRMKELTSMANTIGEIVEIIKDIASQTNLLALNATIEAASAGEAGKGFAVVANEIKNLAKQTGDATNKITEQVKSVQDSVLNSSNDIHNVLEIINNLNDINNGIASALEEQSATINEVSSSMLETSDATKSTVNSIDEVKNNLTEVSGNISEVTKGISLIAENGAETAGSMKEMSKSIVLIKDHAVNTVSGSEQVKASSEELAVLASDLKTIIQKFVI